MSFYEIAHDDPEARLCSLHFGYEMWHTVGLEDPRGEGLGYCKEWDGEFKVVSLDQHGEFKAVSLDKHGQPKALGDSSTNNTEPTCEFPVVTL